MRRELVFLGPGLVGGFEFGGCGWGLIVLVSVFFFFLANEEIGQLC